MTPVGAQVAAVATKDKEIAPNWGCFFSSRNYDSFVKIQKIALFDKICSCVFVNTMVNYTQNIVN